MKKTLFSLAFIAVSGIYVAAANHLLALRSDDASPSAADTALRVPSEQPSGPIASEVPLASPAPSAEESLPATALAAHAIPSASSAEQPLAAEIAPVAAPPLPRPRPAPPQAAVQSAASTAAGTTGGGLQDGTYTGSSENAYYGRVQVEVTIASHRISAIKVLDYPKDRRTSRYINSQALPLLQQEVISASSVNVDTISGATLTSEAYLRSLGRALSQAGGASA